MGHNMGIQQVKRAIRRPDQAPRPSGPSGFDNFLRAAQAGGSLLAATGNPVGAGIAAGASLIGSVTPQQQRPRQEQPSIRPSQVERIDTGPAISRRMDLAQTDPVADLLQAQQALQQLPEEQRRQFEKPIGLAIAEQQRRFS